jgi:hypothetical protein
MASNLIVMFSVPGHVFGDTEGVEFCFHVLRSHTRFRRYRERRVPFSCFALPDSFSKVPRASDLIFLFCASGLIFDGTEGVGFRFHVLRSRTRFPRYLGRRVPFSCFGLPDSFSAIPRASHSVFMCFAIGHVFVGTEGVEYRFPALHARTYFRLYRGRRVSFPCFTLPDIFFGGTEGVRCRFHILRSRTSFWRYRGRRVPFS